MTTAQLPLAAAAPARPAGAARTFPLWMVGLLAAHVLFAFVLREQRSLGGLHAAATFVVLVACAARAPLAWMPSLLLYVGGSEVLWRASKAGVPWEAAKYLVILACGIALVRLRRQARWAPAPLTYFVLLLPSCLAILADPRWGFDRLRQFAASGLAAPLALTMSAWYFSHVELPPERLRRALVAYVLPCVTLATYTAIKTYTNPDIEFGVGSTSLSSGGFGPNQVSSTLGLAALLALIIALVDGVRIGERLLAVALALGTMMQAAITFSRGGVFAAIGALGVIVFFLLWEPRARTRVMLLLAVVVAGTGALFVRADAFTGGALNTRLQNTNPTGRDRIASDDIQMWQRHPVIGVGPAAASANRTGSMHHASHTEYTRVLAEHGTLGAVGMVVLMGALLLRVLRARSRYERMLVSGLLAWSALTMLHVAMRLVAPPLMIGLVFARFPRTLPPGPGGRPAPALARQPR